VRAELFCALALCFGACGDDGGEVTTPDASLPTPDARPFACTHTGFTASSETVERDDDLGVLFYTARAGQAPNIEVLTFDLYFDLGATDAPHEFLFTAENLADCHTCLLMRRDCSGSTCATGKTFLAQEGNASVTAIGAGGSALQGSFQNLKLAEVTIGAGLQTTLVPNGEGWCLDSYSFDEMITTP
jgi:hypothetical protein